MGNVAITCQMAPPAIQGYPVRFWNGGQNVSYAKKKKKNVSTGEHIVVLV